MCLSASLSLLVLQPIQSAQGGSADALAVDVSSGEQIRKRL